MDDSGPHLAGLMNDAYAVDMLPAPLWHHIFRRLLLPPSQPDDPAVIAEDRSAREQLRDADLPVPSDPDRMGSERHRRDADKFGASWPLLCCALASKSLLRQVLSFSESQQISLICNHHDPQWMDDLRFFLHHGGLHSLDLRFTKPDHLCTLGPLVARSSASLTSLDLGLHDRAKEHGWQDRWQDRDGFTLGFLKDCSQLQQLKLGRGEWKLNENCANATWMQSLRTLTLAYMDRMALGYECLDAITPQLTEFTLYECPSSNCLGTFTHSFSFSNAHTLRFLLLNITLNLSLNLAPSLTTLSVMADCIELTCRSDTPLALHQLILYARDRLRTPSLCFASARVVYLNAPGGDDKYGSLRDFDAEPPSRWGNLFDASSVLSWMSWLHAVAPTVEVLITRHDVPLTKMDVEWSSLRSLGIVVEITELDDDILREVSVEDAAYIIEEDYLECFDEFGYDDEEDGDPEKAIPPPFNMAPNLQALFFPSEESDAETLATLKHNYPSLALYCIVKRTYY
ncbi:unnamed protein product [Closterium sp. Naga37s-1]|nr:unnamed protein product [Closterium sp. Naga37s-1]